MLLQQLPHQASKHLKTVEDPIACICATEQCFLVARESGVVHRYALQGPESCDLHVYFADCPSQDQAPPLIGSAVHHPMPPAGSLQVILSLAWKDSFRCGHEDDRLTQLLHCMSLQVGQACAYPRAFQLCR